ncbi:MAG: 4-hydroxy-tetrahydrodipicolinate reductase [Alphaproteobacteria bacterium]
MTKKFDLIIAGPGGRMGRELVRAITETKNCGICGGVEPPGSPHIGADMGVLAGIGPIGVMVSDDPLPLFIKAQGVVDFTRPEATVEFAALAAQARIPHIIGTTGLTQAHEEKIAAAARHAPIVRSGNMSLGVNMLAALVRQVAAALDEDFDIEIVEMHHRDKVDAPSGTALMLGQSAAEGRAVDLDKRAVYSRHGHTGARKAGDIGFATARGGSVVGEHSVVFAGAGERVVLQHLANDRSIFARGAVKAALWARGQEPGVYSMNDVLGLD